MPDGSMTGVTARKIRVYGIVQGVGFRPFTARLARKCGIAGTVCNKGPYVEITAEGSAAAVGAFLYGLKSEAPPRSVILKLDTEEISPAGDSAFRILRSERIRGDIFVSPDIATCKSCAEELYDEKNRRYLHPFINCTACGPRVTILDSMPYDRVRTSMKAFPMCGACEEEYTTVSTRRYHAQPVCCNDCGPALYVLTPGGQDRKAGTEDAKDEALLRTRQVIRDGGIAAIKGIGGFHLCADASNPSAVRRLRECKNRPFKPFAVMMRDLGTVRKNCIVSARQEEILDGPNKPILLLQKRAEAAASAVCPEVAPDNPYLGVMLPYAPVQMLLFSYPGDGTMPDALIMTSGNAKDTPICMNDAEALQFLSPMCDIILSNDREIRLRADDSVMNWLDGEPYMIRRSRGYAPLPVLISDHGQDARPEADKGRAAAVGQDARPEADKDRAGAGDHGEAESGDPVRSVLGIGGELKNTFCLAKNDLLYLSPYIGNLTDTRGIDALRGAVHRMQELLETEPDYIVCDMHPGYLSSRVAGELAKERGIPLFRVQHHYAHVLACMAENDVHMPVIGVSFDGTGYGADGTVWGGEFLIADRRGFHREGSIAPFMQAGGDLAPREGWRIAVALLGDTPARASGASADRQSAYRESDRRQSVYGQSDRRQSEYGQSDCPRDVTGENGRDTITGKELAQRLGICTAAEYELVQNMICSQINTIRSTSAGRIFDAASAVLGLRRSSTSEGEASMVLQFAAECYRDDALQDIKRKALQDIWRELSQDMEREAFRDSGRALPTDIEREFLQDVCMQAIDIDAETGLFRLPVHRLIRKLAEYRLIWEEDHSARPRTADIPRKDIRQRIEDGPRRDIRPRMEDIPYKEDRPCKTGMPGVPEHICLLAYVFHRAMAILIRRGALICRERSGLNTVALTGGVMQNTLLMEMLTPLLEAEGFQVLRHHMIPANDGGIALGQAYYLPGNSPGN